MNGFSKYQLKNSTAASECKGKGLEKERKQEERNG